MRIIVDTHKKCKRVGQTLMGTSIVTTADNFKLNIVADKTWEGVEDIMRDTV